MTNSEDHAAPERPVPNPTIVLLTVSLCTALYAMTVTVVNVTLPQLQGALSATPDQVAWIVTLNLVGTAIVTPLTGWLTAKMGQRRLMIGSVASFAVTSFLCATADSLAPMLFYRIAQGAFGAPIIPISQAILLAVFVGERRAMAQAVFGMAVVVGMGAAPVIGGYVAEEFNWRAVFWLLVPCSVVALAMSVAFIREGGRDKTIKLDWIGFLAISVAIACLQLVLDRGERFGWFESTEIILYAAALTLGLYIFVVQTLTREHTFFNRDLLGDRNYLIGLLLVCVYGMLNFTPITLLPTLLQNLKGYPDSLIGLLLAMRGTGQVIGFFIAGRMGRVDPRISMVLGFVMVGLSGCALAFVELNVSPQHVAWAVLLQGVGSGILWVPITTAGFWSLPPRLLPDGAAFFHLLRNLGQSIYLAVSFLIIVRTTQINYADLSNNINPFNEILGYGWVIGAWSLDDLRGLEALSSEVTRQAQMISFNNAFVLYSVTCFCVIPFVFLWRRQGKSV